jgi:hypothetical protein
VLVLEGVSGDGFVEYDDAQRRALLLLAHAQ